MSTIKTEGKWEWWAGNDEWKTVGPEPTREAVIQAATDDCIGETKDENGNWVLAFEIIEARQDPLRLADWCRFDELIERANDDLSDSDRVAAEYDDGPWIEPNGEQEKNLIERLKKACDDWQEAHGLVFKTRTFSHSRNTEDIVVPHPTPDE